jgi:hypothetical protein
MVSHSVLKLRRKNYLGFQGGNPNLESILKRIKLKFLGHHQNISTIISKLEAFRNNAVALKYIDYYLMWPLTDEKLYVIFHPIIDLIFLKKFQNL